MEGHLALVQRRNFTLQLAKQNETGNESRGDDTFGKVQRSPHADLPRGRWLGKRVGGEKD
tara:strand:- start:712 stop:891 length:180 start_codon:yes stop_codon:yes gene_type:complete